MNNSCTQPERVLTASFTPSGVAPLLCSTFYGFQLHKEIEPETLASNPRNQSILAKREVRIKRNDNDSKYILVDF
jgi:hypothetical protein